jgi:hypothetical protein
MRWCSSRVRRIELSVTDTIRRGVRHLRCPERRVLPRKPGYRVGVGEAKERLRRDNGENREGVEGVENARTEDRTLLPLPVRERKGGRRKEEGGERKREKARGRQEREKRFVCSSLEPRASSIEHRASSII